MAPPPAPARLRLAPHLVLGAFCAGLAGALAVTIPGGPAAVATVRMRPRGGGRSRRAGGRRRGSCCWSRRRPWRAWPGAGFRLAATEPPTSTCRRARAGRSWWTRRRRPTAAGGLRGPGRRGADGSGRRHGRCRRGTRILLDVDDADGGRRLGDAPAAWPGGCVPRRARRRPGWWRAWLERGRGSPPACRVGDCAAGGPPRRPRGGLRDRWRRWARRRRAAGLGGDRAALVRGMALGGGAGLSEPAAQAFRDAGLWHLLAVSGQNVAVVAVAVLALLRGARRAAARRRWPARLG